MNKLIAAASAFGLFTAALWGGSLATAATSQAAPCMTPGGWGNNGFGGGALGTGGGQCDGAPYPDGSFDRCQNVSVLGFGGWNCFRVYP